MYYDDTDSCDSSILDAVFLYTIMAQPDTREKPSCYQCYYYYCMFTVCIVLTVPLLMALTLYCQLYAISYVPVHCTVIGAPLKQLGGYPATIDKAMTQPTYVLKSDLKLSGYFTIGTNISCWISSLNATNPDLLDESLHSLGASPTNAAVLSSVCAFVILLTCCIACGLGIISAYKSEPESTKYSLLKNDDSKKEEEDTQGERLNDINKT
jgi:hypothetical protein